MRTVRFCLVAFVTTVVAVGCAEPKARKEEKATLESAFGGTPRDEEPASIPSRFESMTETLKDADPSDYGNDLCRTHIESPEVVAYLKRLVAHYGAADDDYGVSLWHLPEGVWQWSDHFFAIETNGKRKGHSFYLYDEVREWNGLQGYVVWVEPIAECTVNPVSDELECTRHKKDGVVLYSEEFTTP
jgi:hypothetical protein